MGRQVKCAVCSDNINPDCDCAHPEEYKNILCCKCINVLKSAGSDVIITTDSQFLREVAKFCETNWCNMDTVLYRKLANFLENPRCEICGNSNDNPLQRSITLEGAFVNGSHSNIKGVFCDKCAHLLFVNETKTIIKIGEYLNE